MALKRLAMLSQYDVFLLINWTPGRSGGWAPVRLPMVRGRLLNVILGWLKTVTFVNIFQRIKFIKNIFQTMCQFTPFCWFWTVILWFHYSNHLPKISYDIDVQIETALFHL